MKNPQAITLLFLANIVSGFAQGISMLAIPWYFTSIGKSSMFGVVFGIVTVSSIFWSLYSGTLIDRYPRKNIFLGINVIGMLILGSVTAAGYYQGEVPLSLIIAVFASTFFIFNIHYPSLYAFGQELTEKRNYSKINSYIEIQGQSTSVAAGGVGAILLKGTDNHRVNIFGFEAHLPFEVEAWHLHEIFLIDACTYILAILLILFIRYQPTEKLKVETGSVVKRIKTGAKFLKSNPLIFLFGNASYSIFVIVLVEIFLLLPMYVNNHLHREADIYASSEMYFALGALAAGLSIRWLTKKVSPVNTIIINMLVATGVFMAFAFTRNLLIFFVASLLLGTVNSGTRILRITYLFNHIPNNIIGRSSSVFHVINIILRSTFIGIFALPFFSRENNVVWAYFIGGVFILLSVLPLLKYRVQLRELDKVKQD